MTVFVLNLREKYRWGLNSFGQYSFRGKGSNCYMYIQQMILQHTLPYEYRKNSKIWDTSNNCHNCPKIGKVWGNIALMHPKEADAMANSVDPDQTASSEAVWSWSALFAETYLSQYIEFLRYIGFFWQHWILHHEKLIRLCGCTS